MTTNRTPDHPISPLFLHRWSPRAFDSAGMPADDLLTILEAARWAPSAYNIQPWRFLYALRGDAAWPRFVGVLDSFNAGWAHRASALVVIVSDTVMPGRDGRPDTRSRYHSFDTGAAWAQLALQATALGYQAHAMAGIDADKARIDLAVPDRYKVEIAVAIGRQVDGSILPPDLRDREQPSSRQPLRALALPGGFAP